MADQPRNPRTRSTQWVGVDPSQDEAPRAPLTRARIVRTALHLVEQRGLPTLTMRALATELRVTPMALYNHVRDKDELVDLMADLMIGEVDLSVTDGDWVVELRALVCSLHRVLTAHPGLARIYSSRVHLGPHTLLLMERALDILLRSGFPAPDAAASFFALYTYTVGFHQMGRVDPLDFSAAPPEQIPSITTVAAHLGRPSDGRFEFGLDTLLAGLRTARTPPGDAGGAAR